RGIEGSVAYARARRAEVVRSRGDVNGSSPAAAFEGKNLDLQPADVATAGIRREGLWDSAIDGIFYVTGAVLALGILASHPRLTSAFPESGWEIFAAVLFAAILLWAGRPYAYRQQALDLIGAPYASRLALVNAPIRIDGTDGDPYDALEGHLAAPKDAGGPPVQFVVFGGPGAGKSPLTVAMACEAALAPIDVSPFAVGPLDDLKSHEVRARYTTFQRADMREAEDRVHLRYKAVMGKKMIDGTVFTEGRLLWGYEKATFLVIDNIPEAEVQRVLDGQPSPVMKRLMALAQRPGMRVVWAIDSVRAETQEELRSAETDAPAVAAVYSSDAAARGAREFGNKVATMRTDTEEAPEASPVVLVEVLAIQG
ncbi:MAG: hypothetical protein AAFW69_04595, partial [Pseudomonadota bacterium]